jgi:hypothetical protein
MISNNLIQPAAQEIMYADRIPSGISSAKIAPSLNSATANAMAFQPQAQLSVDSVAFKPIISAPAVADGRDFSGTNNQVSTVD